MPAMDGADGQDQGQDQGMEAYCREGTKKAMALGNRGPIRFTPDGKLHPEILDAYNRCGFYIFENVISARELAELEADFHAMCDRFPSAPGSKVDHKGRPAIGSDHDALSMVWSKPLGDPYGGTNISKNRHPVKMHEPKAANNLPEKIAAGVLGSLQYSDAILRLYAHPDLLRVAAAINGDDFTPFTEAIAIKKPGEGPSIAWHQDGMTHWDNPAWDPDIHGFNYMPQLYGCTAATGVWYLPGTHKLGKCDIKAVVERAGTDRLPEAIPLVCAPGDVCISNRQVVHGSFANTSPDWRVTFNMGFHKRKSVLGAAGAMLGGKDEITYDADLIHKRAAMIGYAIDARRRHYPDEVAYTYKPHADAGETYIWNDAARKESRGYNKRDLNI
jgi:ectoine hydroxylase-related dioxygenase (phytanoyl-CoA dioxygenase family)